MRSYSPPTVTVVELRIEEAVLSPCKSAVGDFLAAQANWAGCWTPAPGSGNNTPIVCSTSGS